MVKIYYPLSLALSGSQAARRWHGVLAPAVGLVVVLAAAARFTLPPLDRGALSRAAAVLGSGRCP
jgi:hypothetical protein